MIEATPLRDQVEVGRPKGRPAEERARALRAQLHAAEGRNVRRLPSGRCELREASGLILGVYGEDAVRAARLRLLVTTRDGTRIYGLPEGAEPPKAPAKPEPVHAYTAADAHEKAGTTSPLDHSAQKRTHRRMTRPMDDLHIETEAADLRAVATLPALGGTLTRKQIAGILGIHPRNITDACERGDIKLAGTWREPGGGPRASHHYAVDSSMVAWMQRRGFRVVHEAPADVPERNNGRAPSEALDAGELIEAAPTLPAEIAERAYPLDDDDFRQRVALIEARVSGIVSGLELAGEQNDPYTEVLSGIVDDLRGALAA